jgi:serine/threonine protein kinase
MMLQIGDQFDHYQIRAHIAQGGMSDIYRAYDLLSAREVVLKVPNRHMIGDVAQFERFQREVEVTQELNHPSIQRGLASGQFNRTPYLVTELISGKSMRDLIQKTAPLSPAEAIALIQKIADGVAYFHDHGVVHRDLKPENVLIREDGIPVILDFGLALTKDGRRVTYANLAGTAGTPEYMAPEQVEGKRGDAHTDQYAVGVMLYELLSGKVPFTGDSPLAIMAQHLRAATPRLDKEAPGVSPGLAAVIARALQRDPAARYPDMRAFIDALDHPDAADISLLEEMARPATSVPAVVALGFLAQAVGGPGR